MTARAPFPTAADLDDARERWSRVCRRAARMTTDALAADVLGVALDPSVARALLGAERDPDPQEEPVPETETADALAAMQTAERAHAELLIAKYAAIGKRVGMWAPELEGDAEIDASYDAMTAAQRAYERACSRDRRRGHS